MRISYKGLFHRGLAWWRRHKPEAIPQILRLVQAATTDPFHGIGEPRLVKELGRGVWARHILDHHYLIYVLERHQVVMYSCCAITEEELD